MPRLPLPSEVRAALITASERLRARGLSEDAFKFRSLEYGLSTDDLRVIADLFNPPPAPAKREPTFAERAAELTAQGYRVVSNRHAQVARIDRPDWVEFLARELHRAPADFYVPGDPNPSGGWCDYYRRVYSRDKLTVEHGVAALIPNSGHDPVGYVEPEAQPQLDFSGVTPPERSSGAAWTDADDVRLWSQWCELVAQQTGRSEAAVAARLGRIRYYRGFPKG